MSIGPDALLANTYCLSEVSKDVNGRVIVLDADQKQCKRPGCKTLTLLQYLRLDLTSNRCDSQLGQLLDGQWRVRNLTTTFTDLSEHSRGVHARAGSEVYARAVQPWPPNPAAGPRT